jgi:hypothetical protein
MAYRGCERSERRVGPIRSPSELSVCSDRTGLPVGSPRVGKLVDFAVRGRKSGFYFADNKGLASMGDGSFRLIVSPCEFKGRNEAFTAVVLHFVQGYFLLPPCVTFYM